MTEPTVLHASITFTGLPGAPGRASGPAFLWKPVAASSHVEDTNPLAALQQAFTAAKARLESALATADAMLAPLLQAQQLMLDDPDLRDGTTSLMQTGMPPGEAVTTVVAQLAEMLEAADSDYFRERAIDVRAVGTLVAEMLAGGAQRDIPRGAVVLAEELAPLDTAQLAEAGVAALVTLRGGPTCHAAIIARAWGIPAVMGVPESVLTVLNETPLLIDGNAGTVITHPTAEHFREATMDAPAVRIARRVPLYANIGSLAEATRAREHGAEGVGLLRTEFLFQDRPTPPSEDEQAEEYATIVRALGGGPVTIRTLDIGADKPVPFLPMPAEANPQLGLRGIRLCLQQLELFRTQLRALVCASAAGPLKIMLPMVCTPDEVQQARAMLQEIAVDLGMTAPPLGAMIEVPMAALAAPELAAVCDFFSLGTNDLMQFLLAADRQHAGVGYLHAIEHQAVWRLIAPVIAAAHAAQIPVGVCGEWGADAEKLSRLVELGIDSVSVAVGALPRVRGMFS